MNNCYMKEGIIGSINTSVHVDAVQKYGNTEKKEAIKRQGREDIKITLQLKLFQTRPLTFLGWNMLGAEVGRKISTNKP